MSFKQKMLDDDGILDLIGDDSSLSGLDDDEGDISYIPPPPRLGDHFSDSESEDDEDEVIGYNRSPNLSVEQDAGKIEPPKTTPLENKNKIEITSKPTQKLVRKTSLNRKDNLSTTTKKNRVKKTHLTNGTKIWQSDKMFETKDIPPSKHELPCQNPEPVLQPIEYFNKYLSDDFFESAATFTNMYSTLKVGKPLKTTKTELKKFFGINLMMGILKYPRLPMYWHRSMGLALFSNSAKDNIMSRDRFLALRSNIHLVDTQNPPPNSETNRLWKVDPILVAFRNRCLQLPRNHIFYSIDEQMIPFTGRCPGLRQCVKNKPRPVGLKNYVVTSSTGMVMDFEIYQGKNTNLSCTELGHYPSVVLRLVQTLPPGSFVYFDRMFTTIPLLEKLSSLELHGTGTLMLNRISSQLELKTEKMDRGQSQQYVKHDGKVVIIEWKDNNKVLMASTCSGVDPETTTQRWSKQDMKYIDVRVPSAIAQYNKYMGGVDVCDQMMELYRTWFRTKKWTLKTILHFLDLTTVNSWFEYKESARENKLPRKKTKDFMKFRLEVAETLLATPDQERLDFSDDDSIGPPAEKRSKYYNPPSSIPCDGKRYDGYDHMPDVDDLQTPRMCRIKGCNGRTKIKCVKCNTYLCLSKNKNCFVLFHRK